MAKIIQTYICVNGSRSGGLSVAARTVQMRAETVLIEGSEMGRDCLNIDCVPSKALLAVGKALKAVTGNPVMGIRPHPTTGEVSFEVQKTKEVICL